MECKQIPLTEAAHRLSMPWEKAWRALLTGRLEGQKRGGRWYVSTVSVERLVAERERVAMEAGTSGGQ